MVHLQDVTVRFRGGLLRRSAPFTALDGISLDVPAGSAHGLVGESGSGKTTLGRVILGLQAVAAGRTRIDGADVAALRGPARAAFRRRVQCVFQDSAASLDPRMTLGASIREGLDIHRIGAREAREERVRAMLERVGLPRALAERYPHEISGGQRQRVNIARSLVLEPRLLIADEPVSALDVSVQAQVLDLLAELRAQMGLTMLFVSHDLMVVRDVCDSVSVLQSGRIVETASTERLFRAPAHPASAALLAAL
jgi:peptide/nickel transport system ATP-binding protein